MATVQVVIPLGQAVGIVLMGAYAYRLFPQEGGFYGLLGSVALALFGGLLYLFVVVAIVLDNEVPYDPYFVGSSVVTFCGLVGAGGGLLQYRLSTIEGSLESQLDRTNYLNQHLSVLNRLLRHNVRNRLTVALGYLEREQAGRSTSTENLQRAQSALDQLLGQTEKTLSYHRLGVAPQIEREETDLIDLVDRVTTAIEYTYPSAEVRTELPERAFALVHPAIELGVSEALENAIVHADSDVTIRLGLERGDEYVWLSIEDDGAGIPESELAVLRQSEETPLRHGSGVGLWLISWAVELSDGELSIERRKPTGTVVEMGLPRSRTESAT
ncbi:MAG: sensor histidine kinase [Haloferacaceae archaeon]